MRLKQVLRNLLSNAIKFTDRGHVKLRVGLMNETVWGVRAPAGRILAFCVEDTGIGIPKDKQRIIFEPFQQVDSGPARRYGGTGLGLSICREIAGLLGGTLEVESEPGKGSAFTLYLPVDAIVLPRPIASESQPVLVPARSPQVARLRSSTVVPDDRDAIQPGDRVLLIVEDDPGFARTLLELARARNFRGIVCLEGKEGLEMARALKPDAVSLDLRLPDLDGWVFLDQLKHDPNTRHIPVHIISGVDDERRGLEQGALTFLRKPVTEEELRRAMDELAAFLDRRVKRLLVVEDDETQRDAIVDLVGADDVEIVPVGSAEDAIRELEQTTFDCMVLDLSLPGMSGATFLDRIESSPALRRVPVIVYTGKELSEDEDAALRRVADSIIVKDVRSPERLLDETALFLHRVEARLPEPKRRMLRSLDQPEPARRGRRVLVVDDDFRNVYAVTAVLEQHQMLVDYAENGRQALEKLSVDATVVVLMDIMLPEMDGYVAMRIIRQRPCFAELPIIALTAKAMKGDREKCIHAGASDYITKPVDPDQLISLLRVWLYR
jgi:CheY-like chemotaxis protein